MDTTDVRICTRYATYLQRMDAELSDITSYIELEKFLEKWTKPIQIIRTILQAAPVFWLWTNKEHLLTVRRLAEDARNKADEWKALENILAGEAA